MDLSAIGAFLLGIFIAYLVWYFVVRFAEGGYTAMALTSIISVVAGGGVVAFLDADGPADQNRWWYPIGLFVGWLIFAIGRTLQTGDFPAFPPFGRWNDQNDRRQDEPPPA